jgi:hypothetical protein
MDFLNFFFKTMISKGNSKIIFNSVKELQGISSETKENPQESIRYIAKPFSMRRKVIPSAFFKGFLLSYTFAYLCAGRYIVAVEFIGMSNSR